MIYILTYSGLVAALTASFLIILPTLFVGLDYMREPISNVVRRKKAGLVFRTGLFVTSALLICNILGVVIRFRSGITLGIASYVLGVLCMTLVGLISIDSKENLHTLFAKGYFVLSFLGSGLFSLYIHSTTPAVIATVGFSGVIILYQWRGFKAYSEYWGIVFSILWIISLYYVD